jgi:hypothetical protein
MPQRSRAMQGSTRAKNDISFQLPEPGVNNEYVCITGTRMVIKVRSSGPSFMIDYSVGSPTESSFSEMVSLIQFPFRSVITISQNTLTRAR